MAMGAPGKITKKKKTKKPMTFGQTFAANRKAGKATFTYKGKKYSTKTKAEVSKKATRKTVKSIKKTARKATAKRHGGIKSHRFDNTMTKRQARKSARNTRRSARAASRKVRRTNRALRK